MYSSSNRGASVCAPHVCRFIDVNFLYNIAVIIIIIVVVVVLDCLGLISFSLLDTPLSQVSSGFASCRRKCVYVRACLSLL